MSKKWSICKPRDRHLQGASLGKGGGCTADDHHQAPRPSPSSLPAGSPQHPAITQGATPPWRLGGRKGGRRIQGETDTETDRQTERSIRETDRETDGEREGGGTGAERRRRSPRREREGRKGCGKGPSRRGEKGRGELGRWKEERGEEGDGPRSGGEERPRENEQHEKGIRKALGHCRHPSAPQWAPHLCRRSAASRVVAMQFVGTAPSKAAAPGRQHHTPRRLPSPRAAMWDARAPRGHLSPHWVQWWNCRHLHSSSHHPLWCFLLEHRGFWVQR